MYIHFSLKSYDPETQETKESAWPKLNDEVRFWTCTPEEYQEIKSQLRDWALKFTSQPSKSVEEINISQTN